MSPHVHAITIVALLFTAGCTSPIDSSQSTDLRGVEAFFDMPIQEQHKRFRSQPIDVQYELYLYSMLNRHPPDLVFADDIASAGSTVVPFLIGKLNMEVNESKQRCIIYVFERLAERGVALRENKEVIELIQNRVSAMRLPLNRQMSEKSLSAILRK